MKILTNLLIAAGFITLASCAKEGCTDPKSTNYDPDAKKSDNSCKFESKFTFWNNEAASNAMMLDGITSLTYYVDGVLIGSSSPSVFFTSAPNCGQTGSVGVTKDLGSNTSKTVTYQVKDQDNAIVWEGTKSLDANTCFTLQLTY